MPHVHPRMLAVHRYLFRLALSAGNLFGWIVVFGAAMLFSGNGAAALALTALLYALAQGISFILTPLAGAALRSGTRRALVIGSLAAAISYAFLAELFLSQFSHRAESAFWLIAGFVVMNGIARALYFVPYATAAAHVGDQRPHALLREFSLALVPLLAGMLAVAAGLGFLFALAAALALTAALAVLDIPSTYERFDWTYRETLLRLFSPVHRAPLGLAFFDGLQGATLLLVWPLVVFVILLGSISSFGAVMTATLLFALAMRWIFGRAHSRIIRSPHVLAVVSFSTWLLRLPAVSPIAIVAVDALYHVAGDPRGRSIDALAFDQSVDGGHYVDEFTALKEMGQSLGRITLCVAFAAMVLILTPVTAFFVCAAMSAVAGAASAFFSHRLTKATF